MMRDPVERVLSTYRHLARFGECDMNGIKDLAKHTQGNNFQTRLLAGGKINLELAIENIDKHFSAVGILEMFDESILLMQKTLSWSIPYYVIENPSHNLIKLHDLDASTVDTIKEYNQVDIELYSLYKRKLQEEIGALGVGFQEILTEFRANNKLNNNNIKQIFVGPGHPKNRPINKLSVDDLLPVKTL